MKANDLINYLDSINEEKFTKDSMKPMVKQMAKSGMRSSTSGRTTTITSPRTKKKVQITDTGREIKIKRIENGKVGKETKTRGLPNDIAGEVDWASKK